MIKFSSLPQQNISFLNAFQSYSEQIIKSGFFANAEFTQRFENAWAEFTGAKFSIGVSSGTSAIETALRALGVGFQDEVIVPTMTFVATVEAVLSVGATPVLVDVDQFTWNIDSKKVSEKITSKTKAIIGVHLHGLMCDVVSLKKIAVRNNIYLIEDAAQAHGALNPKFRIGEISDIATFSFYPGKSLGCFGEAGAIITNRLDLAEKCRLIRNWGAGSKYNHVIRGNNYRMQEFQAAALLLKLPSLLQWVNKRRENANFYDKYFHEASIQTPYNLNSGHAYHIYSIILPDRDLVKNLLSNSVETGIHYPKAVHQNSAYSHLKKDEYPVSEHLAANFLSLPVHENLDVESLNKIANYITEYSHK